MEDKDIMSTKSGGWTQNHSEISVVIHACSEAAFVMKQPKITAVKFVLRFAKRFELVQHAHTITQ